MPEAWQLSNYLEWLSLREGKLFGPGFVREYFMDSAHYRAEMETYLRTRQLEDEARRYLAALEK
jgi:hypothetical protein